MPVVQPVQLLKLAQLQLQYMQYKLEEKVEAEQAVEDNTLAIAGNMACYGQVVVYIVIVHLLLVFHATCSQSWKRLKKALEDDSHAIAGASSVIVWMVDVACCHAAVLCDVQSFPRRHCAGTGCATVLKATECHLLLLLSLL